MLGGGLAAEYSQPKWGTIFGNIQDQTDLIQLLSGLGGGDWGSIGGTITDQADLVNYVSNAIDDAIPEGTNGIEFLNGSYQLGGSFTDVQLTGLASSSFFLQVENAGGGFGGTRTHSIHIDGINQKIQLSASNASVYRGIVYPDIGNSGGALLDYSLVHKGYVQNELSFLESSLINSLSTELSNYLTLTQYNAERHFRGTYTSLANLTTNVPTANAGDFANVDAGVGSQATRYIWDSDDSQWVVSASGGGSVESVNGQLPDGGGNVLLGLGNISNVDLTTPANGELLQFNGTNWVNANPLADYAKLTASNFFTPASSNNFLSTQNATTGSSNELFFTIRSLDFNVLMSVDQFGLGTAISLISATSGGSFPPSLNVDRGRIYVEDGALKYIGTSGTVTTIAAA